MESLIKEKSATADKFKLCLAKGSTFDQVQWEMLEKCQKTQINMKEKNEILKSLMEINLFLEII